MNLPVFPPEPILDASPSVSWQKRVAPFRGGSTARSFWQLGSTLAVFALAWTAAYQAMSVSLWLTALADLVVAGTLVRLFILQHDCGHGSFFRDDRLNTIIGSIPGFLLLTPYTPWRTDHAIHHASTGDLGKRGIGDITTWTVAEYREATPLQRFGYRLLRHPIVMLVGGPIGVFIIGHRFPRFFGKRPTRADYISTHLTTVVGLSLWAAAIAIFGWEAFLLVHVPSMLIAAGGGIFLFYVQHQYEEPYWRKSEDWDYERACLEGSSHLELGPVLRWFSGDIGVHHLHHLAPKIPNYRLRECLAANPELAATTKLSLWDAVKTLNLKLYDEESGRMWTFAEEARALTRSARLSKTA